MLVELAMRWVLGMDDIKKKKAHKKKKKETLSWNEMNERGLLSKGKEKWKKKGGKIGKIPAEEDEEF